jgi:hypothetical protein
MPPALSVPDLFPSPDVSAVPSAMKEPGLIALRHESPPEALDPAAAPTRPVDPVLILRPPTFTVQPVEVPVHNTPTYTTLSSSTAPEPNRPERAVMVEFDADATAAIARIGDVVHRRMRERLQRRIFDLISKFTIRRQKMREREKQITHARIARFFFAWLDSKLLRSTIRKSWLTTTKCLPMIIPDTHVNSTEHTSLRKLTRRAMKVTRMEDFETRPQLLVEIVKGWRLADRQTHSNRHITIARRLAADLYEKQAQEIQERCTAEQQRVQPFWKGELFFKLLVCSSCKAAGQCARGQRKCVQNQLRCALTTVDANCKGFEDVRNILCSKLLDSPVALADDRAFEGADRRRCG